MNRSQSFVVAALLATAATVASAQTAVPAKPAVAAAAVAAAPADAASMPAAGMKKHRKATHKKMHDAAAPVAPAASK
jgi:hypothetical protein